MDDKEIDLSDGLHRRIYAAAVRGKRINSVSILAELLFWRLHCICDDYGLFLADPYDVRHSAFRKRTDITEERVAAELESLRAAELIEFYEVDGERFGRIVDFVRFQPAGRNGRRIRRYPAKSEGIPVNPGESGGIRGKPVQTVSAQVQVQVHKQVQVQDRHLPDESKGIPGIGPDSPLQSLYAKCSAFLSPATINPTREAKLAELVGIAGVDRSVELLRKATAIRKGEPISYALAAAKGEQADAAKKQGASPRLKLGVTRDPI